MPPEAATLPLWPFELRNRLVARPGFRHWAAKFFLTRPVARRQASALFDLCAGFVYSQILQACLQLRLFEVLARGRWTAQTLAERLDMPVSGLERLIDAAAALHLVRRRAGRVTLGPLGAALVDNPAIAAMVAHHAMLYQDLADPVALLRDQGTPTALSRYWAYARATEAVRPDQSAGYTTLMAESQALVAGEILDAYPVSQHRRLLDVGGGDGSFVCAAAARVPALRCCVFDLPPVAELAQARFARAGLSARAGATGGDFLVDPLPHGADLISLVRVVHDHDDEPALALLRRARAALAPAGTLLVAEPMAHTAGAERMGGYFGFYLLAMGSGRPRSAAELRGMLQRVGFSRVRQLRTHTPLLTGVLTARD